ncbi:MAG: hypothetical protein IH621_18880, partial [Krumholzibacteria bacterium]|nr:hypothetical protein [Candidatus Krumholzibacteria bacterium]
PPTVETRPLRELWRLDNEADPDLPLLGTPTQSVVDGKGHLLVLDGQMAHVLEISPAGGFLRTLGRSGQGPGEMENPNTLFLDGDDRLGVVQMYPGRIVILGRDGTPGGSIASPSADAMLYRVAWVGDGYVAAERRTEHDADLSHARSHAVLARYGPDGERRCVYMESTVEESRDPPVMDEGAGWFPYRAWDVAADGSVLVAAARDAYRIDWYEPDGSLRCVLTRPFTPHRRNAEERAKVKRSMRMWRGGAEIELKKIILDTEPVIDEIRVHTDGRIWVRTCYADRDLPDGILRRYDMLADGRVAWYRNARSAVNARFAAIEDRATVDEDLSEDELRVQVILLAGER